MLNVETKRVNYVKRVQAGQRSHKRTSYIPIFQLKERIEDKGDEGRYPLFLHTAAADQSTLQPSLKNQPSTGQPTINQLSSGQLNFQLSIFNQP